MLYIKKKMAELIAQHTGQTVEQIERGLRPRPLVHRRGGQGLRPRRPRRRQRRRGRRRAAAPRDDPRPVRRPDRTPVRRSPPDERRCRPARASGALHPAQFTRSARRYGFRRVDPYAKLFEERIIFLGSADRRRVANDVMAQLLCLESMDPDRDIQIYINSPGGSFTALTAIYDTMQFVKPDVQTVCLGQAASAAAVLLAAGTPGKRLALPNSRILIHQPYTEGGGQASDIEIQANEILRMRELLEKMLAEHTDRDARGGQPRHRARQDPHRRGGRRVRPDRPGARAPGTASSGSCCRLTARRSRRRARPGYSGPEYEAPTARRRGTVSPHEAPVGRPGQVERERRPRGTHR